MATLPRAPPRPSSAHLVGGPGGEDELAVGVEAQAVHLGGVRVHRVAGLGRVVGPRVPAGEHDDNNTTTTTQRIASENVKVQP